jgi:hypothetical protein
MDDAKLSETEAEIIRGTYQNGVYQILFKPNDVIDPFYEKIATHLNMTASGRMGFVVTKDTKNEVFEKVVEDDEYYTILVGYMPKTIIKTVEKIDDISIIVDIEFGKGDLLILKNTLQYTYGNQTYTTNKIFEVVYMYFGN